MMRALVKYAKGPGLTELREVATPVPGPGEVLVRVKVAAVCASDLHLYHDSFPCEPPLILGHEFSGEVCELGPGVVEVSVGDRIVSENNPQACGTCGVCASGYPNLCPEKRAIGFRRDGCFADYVVLPAVLLHHIPDGVSWQAAALSEPLAVATHAVEDRCGITRGDVVVVLGPGAIGLLAGLVARAEGAGRVIMAGTDRDDDRLACAAKLGLDCFNVQTDDLAAHLLELTNGLGADVVVEAAGAAASIDLATRLVRRAGRMVAIGITGKPTIPVAWDTLVAKAATLAFSYSSRRRNWCKAMEYLRDGRVPAEALITDSLSIDRWQDAFHQMEQLATIRTVFTLGDCP